MRVVYTGPSPALMVPGVGRVERGEPVDVPADHAKALVAQQGWARATRRRGNRNHERKG